MALLGGEGYDLARRLEASSSWRPWLGDALYAELQPHLASPTAWASFMQCAGSPSSVTLQLRVRALLYDKALGGLFSEPKCGAVAVSQLNPAYLQLQADGIYFTLEHDVYDWIKLQTERSPAISALQIKHGLDQFDMFSNQYRDSNKLFETKHRQCQPIQSIQDIFAGAKQVSNIRTASGLHHPGSDIWYDQWFTKNTLERMQRLAWRIAQQKLPFGEQETSKRTPENMAAYVAFSQKSWKRHCPYLLDMPSSSKSNKESFWNPSMVEPTGGSHELKDDLYLLPEFYLPTNPVPDNPCPKAIKLHDHACASRQSHFVLEGSLQQNQCGKSCSKDKLHDSEANHLTEQSIIRITSNAGFEGLKQIPMEILSELLACHIRKLGGRLKILLDNYKRSCKPIEILHMFIYSAVGSSSHLLTVTEYIKTAISVSQTQHQQDLKNCQMQQQIQQSQLKHFQRQTPLQFHTLPQQLISQQQLQLEKKRKQPPPLRTKGNPNMDFSGSVADSKSFLSVLSPTHQSNQQQQHLHQQQSLLASQSHLSLHNFKQQSSSPSNLQHQGAQKLQHVKVEGLQEILGVDGVKQETEDMEGILGSPSKRKR